MKWGLSEVDAGFIRRVAVCCLLTAILVLSPIALCPVQASPIGDKDQGASAGNSELGRKDMKTSAGTEPRVLMHIHGHGRFHSLAVGLNILIGQSLIDSQGVNFIPWPETIAAARKGNVLRQGYHVHVHDIPYLSLATDASVVVLAQLEEVRDRLSLSLRSFDPASGKNLKSLLIDTSSARIGDLISKTMSSLSDLFDRPIQVAGKADENEYSAQEVSLLGQAWLKIGTDPKKINEGLLELLSARDEGLSFQKAMKAWLPVQLGLEKKLADSDLSRVSKALVADLMGDTAFAAKTYAKIKDKRHKLLSVKIRQAGMLLDKNSYTQAMSLLQKLEKRAPNNAEIHSMLGEIHLEQGRQPQAISEFRRAAAASSKDVSVYEALGRAQLDPEKAEQAAGFLFKAAELLQSKGKVDRSISLYLDALTKSFDSKRLDELPIEGMTLEQQKRLSVLLNETKQQQGREMHFARARLAAIAKDLDLAQENFEAAIKLDDRHFETNLAAGEFFLYTSSEIDKAIYYLSKALKRNRSSVRVWRNLARVYKRARFCNKCISSYRSAMELEPENDGLSAEYAEALISCNKLPQAEKFIEDKLKKSPNYGALMASKVKLYRALGDRTKADGALASLRLMDIRIAGTFDLPKATSKDSKTVHDSVVSKKPPVVVTFPVVKNLIKAVPVGLKRVALLDKQSLTDTLPQLLIRRLTSSSLVAPAVLEEDLRAIISREGAQLVDLPDPGDLIQVYSGKHVFRPDSFDKAIEKHKLDGVVLYKVTSIDGAGDLPDLKVDLYCFVRGKTEMLHADSTISLNQEILITFNPYILVIPFLLLLMVAVLVMFRIMRGFGGLTVDIRYEQTFEKGYFGLKLVGRELPQAFDLEQLLKMEYTGEKEDTEKKISEFFRSRSRFSTMAERYRGNFTKIPPGHYTLYVGGVLVNIDTNLPVSTHEVRRTVTISKNESRNIEIVFEVIAAMLEVRVTREAEDAGSMTSSSLARYVEIDGAQVQINNNQALTKISVAGQPTVYHLPLGKYEITASHEGQSAVRRLEIQDTSPQSIELRLNASNASAKPIEAASSIPLSGDVAAAKDGQSSGPQFPAPLDPAELPKRTSVSADGDVDSLPPEGIELSDDNIMGAAPIITHDHSGPIGKNAISSLDLDDLFKTQDGASVDELFEMGSGKLDESTREQYKRRAKEMEAASRYDEAAELYMRSGIFEKAASMCQHSGNQTMTYKVYGMSYLQSGNFREAVEMFKFADETLLEAEALEGLRLFDEANRKRGSHWETMGDIGKALEAYEKAGAWDRIGEVHERFKDFDQAGEAYFNARLYSRAGECFIKAKDVKRAAESFEMDAQWDQAADLYKQLGADAKVFHLLEKAGRFFEAAEGYKKFGLFDEAVHACQQVPHDSDDYMRASLIMGKIFIERNELDLARSSYYKVAQNADITQDNIERFYEFGVLIQEQGMIHEAFALFERLQTIKYNYADVSIRMQNLKESIEDERSKYGTAPPPGTVPPFPGFRTSAAGLGGAYSTPAPTRETPVSSRYVFEKELGRGAMGIVYQARDTALDRSVAYKTVSNAIKENPASLKYFLSEAKSLAALNHMNIVTVFDVGQENENYFITMEYVDGRSLSEFISEKGRLSTKNVVVIASKICAGLEYAHNKNVVHRDIKPSNVMISNDGEVKIMDFGLAKIMTEAVQDRTIVRGTPLYMAPEQVEGVGVDHRSDIYSFGVTIFEMATGTLPFTKGDIAYHHLHTPPPSPVRYNPSIPESLEKIILTCLEKKKEDRYQNSAEIKKDLAPLRSALMRGDI